MPQAPAANPVEAQPGQGAMQADPTMGADPNAMTQDPNAAAMPEDQAIAQDPTMGVDPNAMPTDGMEGEEQSMDDTEGSEMPEGADDSTMSLFAQLDPKDKETARKYIISMLQDAEEGENTDTTAEQPEQQQQVAETVILKKGQILAIQESERKEAKKSEVLKKHKNNKSPWNSPKFK